MPKAQSTTKSITQKNAKSELSAKIAHAKQQVKQATQKATQKRTRQLAPFFRPRLKTMEPAEYNYSFVLGYN